MSKQFTVTHALLDFTATSN